MVQVNRVCLKILFINRPQFLVDSNVVVYKKSGWNVFASTFQPLFIVRLRAVSRIWATRYITM